VKEELRVVNALIGMSVGVPGWPQLLKQEGFRLVALEQEISVRIDPARRCLIKPEAIFFSVDRNQTLLVEAKSASFNPKQALGYAKATAADLVAMGLVPPDVDQLGHVVVPCYFAPFGHEDDLSTSIGSFNHERDADLPLVVYSNHSMYLAAGSVRNRTLHTAFDGHVAISEATWPTTFVPFDSDSPKCDIAGPVVQVLMQYLLNDEINNFTVDDIAGGHTSTATDGCVRYFQRLGPSKRAQIRSRITEIVEELRISYLSNLITRTGNHDWVLAGHLRGRGITTVNQAFQEYRALVEQGQALPPPRQRDVLGQVVADDD
jgi:hypothetical protein